MAHNIKVALAGNPNCGKSTIFNALTGSHQHVGNWPGKTVEKKAGNFRSNGHVIELVDLPGTYSLSPYSQEEVIARDFIISEKPDVIISVLDASNLERNLYMTTQLIELERPVIVALNMMDSAENRGMSIDVDALSQRLGLPVVPMVAFNGKGVNDLVKAVVAASDSAGPTGVEAPAKLSKTNTIFSLGNKVDAEVSLLRDQAEGFTSKNEKYPTRWLALKLLEQDCEVLSELNASDEGRQLIKQAQAGLSRLEPVIGEEDFETYVADKRYTTINSVVKDVLKQSCEEKITLSDRIDRIVTHRIWGIPIFLGLMWAVFKITTDFAAPFLDWVDGAISGPLTRWVVALLNLAGLSGTWVESLFVDGIIAGVGGVLVFVPVLMALYMALAILEDSGYMARAAFVMDRLMRSLGLHGKSFLPMIVGFGCTVPALYATRTLENDKDRILTGLLVPFISCGARLPVYVLFAGIFFPAQAGWAIFSMYLLGIVVAILLGMILRRTLFRNAERSPFVLELPPYRLPTLKGIWIHMWERTSGFVRKAWTIILGTSVLVWLFLSIPVSGGQFAEVDARDSAFASVSKVAAPAFAPAGFGSWEASGALVTGFVAKEVVVSTLSQAYGLVEEEPSEEEIAPSFGEDLVELGSSFGLAAWDAVKSLPGIVGINLAAGEEEEQDTALMQSIKSAFNTSSGGHGALAAVAYMVFVLLYTPCMVAVAAERQELGMKWTWFNIVGQLIIAWVFATVVFQGGLLLGIG
ncbi:MAG: ferrous iron transport protein B [Anaerolineaceae bacterium]|nr:ferrous iron transport protein B [Anaerolineaceae bacterium]